VNRVELAQIRVLPVSVTRELIVIVEEESSETVIG
jgi:hypothetical protein